MVLSSVFIYRLSKAILMRGFYWLTLRNGVRSIFMKKYWILRNNSESIVNHDQDVLNVVCGNKLRCCHTLGILWTIFLWRIFDYHKIGFWRYIKKKNIRMLPTPVIIHSASRPKPWERLCIHPFVSEFDKYLRLTPYKKDKKEEKFCRWVLEFSD